VRVEGAVGDAREAEEKERQEAARKRREEQRAQAEEEARAAAAAKAERERLVAEAKAELAAGTSTSRMAADLPSASRDSFEGIAGLAAETDESISIGGDSDDDSRGIWG